MQFKESSDMELHVYTAFVIATAVMIALPGPSVLLTVAHSISFGCKHAMFTVAGATIGIAAQLIIAIIGLSSLLNVVAGAFEWLRWAGAVYLVYLGIKQWKSAGVPLSVKTAPISNANLFVQGFVVTTFNPKSLIFIAAFLPQFIDAASPAGSQFSIIVPTFLFISFAVTSLWVLVAGKVGGVLQGTRALKSVLRTAGGLMIVSGVGLAMARRVN
jgi:threonine/homoserine/homoserine lactone efflux protein